jgi:RNA polymerase sigma factor (sigma-70 family)
MANGQLDFVVRRIRKLAGLADPDRRPDKPLLESFIVRRDSCAFAELVERHGPMVLSLCRRLLGNRHDAEDAFQATFLVLIRKARSIRKKDSLASWLHGVAYRVAREARVKSVRRRAHERQVSEMPPTDPASDVLWRDLRLVLDEELQRLPDKYRVPLILCYLEGKTTDEAARLLGWPRGTVGGRLARARQMLRSRLARRGMALSAGSLATALASTTASASIPPTLADATLKAAAVLAAGQAMTAAAVSEQVAALTEGTLKAMLLAKVKVTGAALLAVSVIGTGLLAHQALAGKQANAQQGEMRPSAGKAATQEQRSPPANTKVPPVDENPKDKTTFAGQVMDEQGQPLAEAAVAVFASPSLYGRDITRKPLTPLILGSTKTNAQGRFQVVTPRLTAREDYFACWVAAGAKGYGLGWHQLISWQQPVANQPKYEFAIRLPREQVFRGRLMDLQGQPVRNVKVYVKVVATSDKDPSSSDGVSFSVLPDNPPEGALWPGPALTDDEGRFSLYGIGPGCRLVLHFRDERYTPEDWEVDPASKTTAEEITHTLAPARMIVGQVTFADTKKPVPYACLFVDASESVRGRHFVYGTADANGRFSIVPYAGDYYSITASATEEEHYLARAKGFFTWPRGGALTYEINLSLPRGILLRGKIIEEASGKPVAGARLGYWRQRKDNPYYQRGVDIGEDGYGELRARSNVDGSFRLAVFPGPGHLLVKGPTPDYIQVETSIGELEGGKPSNSRYHPDGLVLVNHKPGSEPAEMTVKLRRGVTIRGQVLQPNGQAATELKVICPSYVPKTLRYKADFLPIQDGRFELPGCDPEKTYTAFFVDEKNQLGAAVELPGKETKEGVTVRLALCGTARVRFVDEQKKPFAKHQLYGARPQPFLVLVLTPGSSTYNIEDLQADAVHWVSFDKKLSAERFTGADGRLTFSNLIPGAPYRIVVHEKAGTVMKREFTVKAGESLELGDVVMKREE